VRRVGALPAPPLEQLPRARPHQHRLEEQPRRRAGGETTAELAQDRGVETRVVDVQPQHVFPVEPRAHRVGGLPIREPFRELEDGRQREPPGSGGWLAAAREERGERAIGEHLTERIGRGQGGMTFREGRARDPRGLGGDRRERLGA